MPSRIFRYFFTLFTIGMASPLLASDGFAVGDRNSMVADQPAARSIAVGSALQLWPAGVIPYTLDPALPVGSVLAINRAIRHWNEVGGISLLPLVDVQSSTGTDVEDSVRFTTGDYCASWVGRRGGQQDLWVASNCPSGSIMHEIGHLLGLEHEHTRPDRDQYIQVHWDNVSPDKQHNFDLAPANSRLPTPYDYDSIMHYGSHNFSSNGEPTITALDGVSRGIGQRVAPSAGDLQAIADLYGTDLSVVTYSAASGSGSEVDIYISNHSDQGAHDIRVDIGTGLTVAELSAAQGDWRCESGTAGGMSCELARLPASAVELITLSLPDSQLTTELDVDVTLSSKTPDNNPLNNTSNLLSDGADDIPGRSPLEQLTAALGNKTEVQEDAVAQVAVGSGSASVFGLAGLLILCVGQAGRRVYL